MGVLTGNAVAREEEEHRELVRKILEIYGEISKLPSLKPCEDVNALFTRLVLTCIPPTTLNVAGLPAEVQASRAALILLCAEAEANLEAHYSSLLAVYDNPLDHLHRFPYYSNYLKLAHLEHDILAAHYPHRPSRVAFIGSGPLPLTSIVLATHYMHGAAFHNYDLSPEANARAARLVAADPDLSRRMTFHTRDILDAREELRGYDVVFLAALVGMGQAEKARVIAHLAEHMAPGAVLMLRSAAGARAFLYPVVDGGYLCAAFEVLEVHHPTDEVINSVIMARRRRAADAGKAPGGALLPCKCCSEVRGFRHGSMMEEVAVEEAG